jgi:hypothetical protein
VFIFLGNRGTVGILDGSHKFHGDTLLKNLFEKLDEHFGCDAGRKLYGLARLGRVKEKRRISANPVLKRDVIFAPSGFGIDIDLDLVLQHIPDKG